MVWKWLGALVVFPLQMIYLVVKAAVGLVLPAKLRDLSRENVLITGGGRGIGRQLAREFAERGARKIVLWGRTEKCLKETTEEIRQMGTECHYFICDVGNREEVYQTAKAVREKVGDITILVNNAAVVHGKSLMDSDDDALLKSQHVNTLGQFWTTKAFLPRMLELQNGHIVCLNSVLALSAIPGAIDYCTSKASAFAFMESLTLGLLDCPGVSATTVLPFHTSTEMFQGMRVRTLRPALPDCRVVGILAARHDGKGSQGLGASSVDSLKAAKPVPGAQELRFAQGDIIPRFPNLFPPLKPETVARRTVEAVQLNQALLLLPWTMHALIILKSILPQAALEEIHKFSGTYTCMNTFKGRT
ncbi:short-chain dehydrogenase/reductase 3 isoform X2 [Neophocaena asiaeorientalis asiaeorientalis]|uniref:Short-chain dehydrogenase/reductase 3 n=1 Tax=Neophocaena asiaeorientalis asiaeorientalis TaxID=1706337 RepID=A0A341BV82_NEOAA|nr:short-chain dehydrogenase/reductase 3 isoform X2 [Neophocaena asiaeorientalis asiaeorientalis]XP_032458783.1 short-chain dehydrogenase/reductase 3 isoform X2 [Phocoena sinus]